MPPVKHEDGLSVWRSGQRSGRGVPMPRVPAIYLHYPKYPHNVGQVVRLASCYGISQVWYSGSRVSLDNTTDRLPREERMRGYEDVTLIRSPDPLSLLLIAHPDACPVAVELRSATESLPDFRHPDEITHGLRQPIYVFGPEDGSLPGQILKRCHRFVTIPSFQCLNLATSVATVLYDRMTKLPLDERPVVRDRGVGSVRGDLATSSRY